jgi:hypothetical protein
LKKCLDIHSSSTIISCDEKAQICTKNDANKGLTAHALSPFLGSLTQDSSREDKANKTCRLTVYSEKLPQPARQQIFCC